MSKTILFLSAALIATACATGPNDTEYAELDCDDLRALVAGQDYAASVRGVEFYSDRGVEETRHESGSPWAGRAKTRNDSDLKAERQVIRQVYRKKNCPA